MPLWQGKNQICRWRYGRRPARAREPERLLLLPDSRKKREIGKSPPSGSWHFQRVSAIGCISLHTYMNTKHDPRQSRDFSLGGHRPMLLAACRVTFARSGACTRLLLAGREAFFTQKNPACACKHEPDELLYRFPPRAGELCLLLLEAFAKGVVRFARHDERGGVERENNAAQPHRFKARHDAQQHALLFHGVHAHAVQPRHAAL